MSWVPLDDRFWSHPKVLAAGNEAVGFLVRCWSYSAAHGTGGHVLYDAQTYLAGSAQKAASLRARLESGRLLDRCEVHARCSEIHDWSTLNETESEAQARREAEAEKKRRQRANRRRTLNGQSAGQGVLSPGDTGGDTWGDDGGDTLGDIGGDIPGDMGGDLVRAHGRGRSQSQSQSHSGSLLGPPHRSTARGGGLKADDTPASIVTARRRAAGNPDPNLDGWDTASIRRVCTEAGTRFGSNREDAYERLILLAGMSETRSPGRLLEHGAWEWAGREADRIAADAARREREDDDAIRTAREHDATDTATRERAARIAHLLDADPDGWQAAMAAAADALRAENAQPLRPLVQARALALYDQETART